MIYLLPLLGHIIGFIAFASLALPFWLFWTVAGMGEKYFYFVPQVYHQVGFLESWMLFSIISILKFSLTPKFSANPKDMSDKIAEISKDIKKLKTNKD